MIFTQWNIEKHYKERTYTQDEWVWETGAFKANQRPHTAGQSFFRNLRKQHKTIVVLGVEVHALEPREALCLILKLAEDLVCRYLFLYFPLLPPHFFFLCLSFQGLPWMPGRAWAGITDRHTLGTDFMHPCTLCYLSGISGCFLTPVLQSLHFQPSALISEPPCKTPS